MLLILIGLVILLVIYHLTKCPRKLQPSKEHAVFITGCDSGIGYSLACHSLQHGLTVFAGCLSLGSSGALQLQEFENVHLVQVDVSRDDSIRTARSAISKILAENPTLKLQTLVNNAGIMIFGEFSWLTSVMIEQQIAVNLVGAMKVTSAFMSEILKNEGRIINICSHCSSEALPGLSVYAASKSGLLAWSNALRMELKKFNIPVISLTPGSYPFETNILTKQEQHAEEMNRNMTADDWKLYGNYFREYNAYLCSFGSPELKRITDGTLYAIFDEALLCLTPKPHYTNSPLRYKLYHTLFRITPTNIRDQLIIQFMNMPKWRK